MSSNNADPTAETVAIIGSNSAKKFDADKPQVSLVPQLALMEVAKVMQMGANKYGRFNYRNGMDWTRLVDANMRHSLLWIAGEDNDPESGLSHIAHAAANCLMLLEFELYKLGKDDRYVHDKE